MDKLARKKALLDRIRFAESAEFECDENAVLEVYKIEEEIKTSLPIKVV